MRIKQDVDHVAVLVTARQKTQTESMMIKLDVWLIISAGSYYRGRRNGDSSYDDIRQQLRPGSYRTPTRLLY
jgi:hypothetical protein